MSFLNIVDPNFELLVLLEEENKVHPKQLDWYLQRNYRHWDEVKREAYKAFVKTKLKTSESVIKRNPSEIEGF